MTRTLVIGLDAATWSVIDPLLESNELPYLQSIIEDGAWGTLNSTLPPMTPLAWTSMATGVNPGKHGIYDFLELDAETYRVHPTNYSRMTRPTVWDICSAKDVNVGVVNYPLVRPPDEVDSFFISGIPASIEEKIASPEPVQSYIESEGYRVTPSTNRKDGVEAYYRDVQDLTKTQADVVIELLHRYDPDLCWTVFMGIDWIQHYLWNESIDGRNAVESFYMYMDQILGRLCRAVSGDSTVIVVSDHGARRIEGEIHVNSLLDEWGYLARRQSDRLAPDGLRQSIAGIFWELGRRLPESVKSLVKQSVSDDTLTEVQAVANVGQLGMHNILQWDQTVAFSYGYMGRMFVNRTDRYPTGIVSPEAYEGVVDELIERLESLTHPDTGEPLVDRAIRGQDVYSDDALEGAPDVLFVPREWRYMAYGDFDDEWIHEPKSRVADHDSEGILIVSGPQFEEDVHVDADVVDFAPTLLTLHGLPLLDDMDGEVLDEIFIDESHLNHEFDFVSLDEFDMKSTPRRAFENKGVEERLEDLGYL